MLVQLIRCATGKNYTGSDKDTENAKFYINERLYNFNDFTTQQVIQYLAILILIISCICPMDGSMLASKSWLKIVSVILIVLYFALLNFSDKWYKNFCGDSSKSFKDDGISVALTLVVVLIVGGFSLSFELFMLLMVILHYVLKILNNSEDSRKSNEYTQRYENTNVKSQNISVNSKKRKYNKNVADDDEYSADYYETNPYMTTSSSRNSDMKLNSKTKNGQDLLGLYDDYNSDNNYRYDTGNLYDELKDVDFSSNYRKDTSNSGLNRYKSMDLMSDDNSYNTNYVKSYKGGDLMDFKNDDYTYRGTDLISGGNARVTDYKVKPHKGGDLMDF